MLTTPPPPQRDRRSRGTETSYEPPTLVQTVSLQAITSTVRPIPGDQQRRFGFDVVPGGRVLHYAGDLSLLERPTVAIVGSRAASEAGLRRAQRLARELVEAGVVVVSGLAAGIDTAAHQSAIAAGGRTIAVIGTPLDQVFPAANRRLQEQIHREHLLVSEFSPGARVFKGNFPARNKTMAALTDATAIMEADEGSGTHHQGWECIKLQRWLFIPQSIIESGRFEWTRKYLAYDHALPLRSTQDVLDRVLRPE